MREGVCKNCGGKNYKVVGQNMVKCMFCGTLYVDELASKEEEVLVVGAFEKLRGLKFDEAIEEFDKILELYPNSFNSFYGKALAKHKIVFYGKRPRFFDTPSSILEDEDFLSAIKNAPPEEQKELELNAKKIESVVTSYTENDGYDVVVCSFSNENETNLPLENYKTYVVDSKDKEEETFFALKTCKALVVCANDSKGYVSLKHVFDRYKYFVYRKEKSKNSFNSIFKYN